MRNDMCKLCSLYYLKSCIYIYIHTHGHTCVCTTYRKMRIIILFPGWFCSSQHVETISFCDMKYCHWVGTVCCQELPSLSNFCGKGSHLFWYLVLVALLLQHPSAAEGHSGRERCWSELSLPTPLSAISRGTCWYFSYLNDNFTISIGFFKVTAISQILPLSICCTFCLCICRGFFSDQCISHHAQTRQVKPA